VRLASCFGRCSLPPGVRRRRWTAIAVAAGAALTVGALVYLGNAALATTGPGVDVKAVGSRPLPKSPDPFGWLVARPAPSDWKQRSLPNGAGVLSYPPDLHVTKGDPGSISVALVNHGSYVAYLNATPQEGNERLSGWASFRVGHLLDDDASSVREEASAVNRPFLEGRGSCVIDDYVTKVGHHPFREIACIVRGARHQSVVIAAAPPSDWERLGPMLERAVASYGAR
jgi:hypothetical protein